MNELKKKEVCDEAIELKKTIETHFLALGEKLLIIKQNSLYAPLYDTWLLFLDEMRMSESMASRLMGIYEKFILEYRIAPAQVIEAGNANMQEILPHANTEKKAKELVHLAETLTRQHLREELKELKSGREMGDCAHNNSYIIKIKVCRGCGSKERVYEEV